MKQIKQFLESDNVYRIELIFKIIYILHLLACFNPFIDGRVITKITLLSTMAFGGLLLLCRVASFKRYSRTPAILFLILFLISFAVPSLLIYRYAVIDSIKTSIWMVFQFCLLFAFDYKKDRSRVKKELSIVSMSILAFVTLENLVSVIMAFTGYFRMYEKIDGTFAITGLSWWGRLYGVHGDPNYACIYTIAAIMIAVYFFTKHRNTMLRIVLALAAICNFLFISFSASRSGVISLVIATAVFTFTYFIGCCKNGYRVLKSITMVMIACVMVVALNKGVIKGFNTFETILHSSENGADTDDTSSENEDGSEDGSDKDDSEDEEIPTIGRTEEEMNGDITNRRGSIWKNGFEIFSKNAVFGIGFENILGYAHDKMPDLYIINNDLTEFDAFHNTVIDILVSQGGIGILLALTFALTFIVYCFKRITKQYDINREELCLSLSICVSTITSAMFLSHIFYVNIASTGIFWLFAGYLACLLYSEK